MQGKRAMLPLIKKGIRNFPRQEGWIGTVILFLAIGSLFFYYFFSSRGSASFDISDRSNEGYIDQNVVAIDTLDLLEKNEISIAQNESKNFKNKNFEFVIKRGPDFKNSGELMPVYLLSVTDTRSPSKLYEYEIAGLPEAMNFMTYHIVLTRVKTVKGY
jgi:hypothetical protein